MTYTKKISAVCMWVVIAVMFTTVPGVAGESEDKTSIKAVKQEAQDLMEALKSYSADQRDEAVQQAGKTLDKLDKRIDALETDIKDNWEQMSRAARKQTRENLQALREQRNQVAEWYGSMKTSSADAWEEIKKGFSHAYEALSNAWTESVEEFDSDKKK
ncbi:MAG: hypothetical protein R6V15_02485 [Desulfotignum sp.]